MSRTIYQVNLESSYQQFSQENYQQALDLVNSSSNYTLETIVIEDIIINNDNCTWMITNDIRSIEELLLIPSSLWEDSKRFQPKKAPTIKGEQILIEYYKTAYRNQLGQLIYENLALKETNSWEYYIDTSVIPAKKYPMLRNTILDYYYKDGTIGYTDYSVKVYDFQNINEITPIIQKRHENIINEAKIYLFILATIGYIDYSNMLNLLNIYSNELNIYISGFGAPLDNALLNSNDSDLNKNAFQLDYLTYLNIDASILIDDGNNNMINKKVKHILHEIINY